MNMITFSVIVCTYNRVSYLIDTIASILKTIGTDSDIELIIIDNNSTDNTSTMVEAHFRTDQKVRYVREMKQGLSHARNRGITEAAGDFLIFLDDDIELHEQYFAECRKMAERGIMIFGGKVMPFHVSVPEWLPTEYYFLVSIFDLGSKEIKADKLMGANYGMSKKVAQQVGEYNPDLGRKGTQLLGGEEVDYLNRAKNLGFEIIYSPDIIVYHKINDKLNKKYVLDYARLLGKSEALIDSKNKVKRFSKFCKSLVAIVAYQVSAPFVQKPSSATYLNIISEYGKGYIK